MADNMMRVAGREPISGLAKALKTDADGNLGVKLQGTVIVKDDENNDVVRVFDAHPHGYEPSEDAHKILLPKAREIIFQNLVDFASWNVTANYVYLTTLNPSYYAFPLDISKYNKVAISIRNNTNFAFTAVRLVAYYKSVDYCYQVTQNMRCGEIDLPQINAGATLVLNFNEHLDFGKLPITLAVRLTLGTPVSGDRAGSVEWAYVGERL